MLLVGRSKPHDLLSLLPQAERAGLHPFRLRMLLKDTVFIPTGSAARPAAEYQPLTSDLDYTIILPSGARPAECRAIERLVRATFQKGTRDFSPQGFFYGIDMDAMSIHVMADTEGRFTGQRPNDGVWSEVRQRCRQNPDGELREATRLLETTAREAPDRERLVSQAGRGHLRYMNSLGELILIPGPDGRVSPVRRSALLSRAAPGSSARARDLLLTLQRNAALHPSMALDIAIEELAFLHMKRARMIDPAAENREFTKRGIHLALAWIMGLPRGCDVLNELTRRAHEQGGSYDHGTICDLAARLLRAQGAEGGLARRLAQQGLTPDQAIKVLGFWKQVKRGNVTLEDLVRRHLALAADAPLSHEQLARVGHEVLQLTDKVMMAMANEVLGQARPELREMFNDVRNPREPGQAALRRHLEARQYAWAVTYVRMKGDGERQPDPDRRNSRERTAEELKQNLIRAGWSEDDFNALVRQVQQNLEGTAPPELRPPSSLLRPESAPWLAPRQGRGAEWAKYPRESSEISSDTLAARLRAAA